MEIRDPRTQHAAEVTSDFKLAVAAIQRTSERNINETTGKVWSVPFKAIDPASTDDYFIYIKNDGNKIIEVTDFRLSSTVVGTVEVQVVSGTASGGSSLTPVGRNLGVQLVPTNTILQSGSDITGLNNDGVLFFIPLEVVNKLVSLRTTAGILITPGKSIALLWTAGTGAITGTISLHEIT